MNTPNLRSRLKPLTPHRERPDTLDSRTVGRTDLLAALHRRFRSAATSANRTHTLLIGPRGSGKSHVISVALHRLQADETIRDLIAVARIDEDVVGIRTYGDLMIEVLRSLGATDEDIAAAKANRTPSVLEGQVLEVLGERTMLLVVENLSRLFDQVGIAGQRNLRSFVETSARVMVLASTPLLTASIADRSEPWFGSFTPEVLDDLTLDQGSELLRQIALADADHDFAAFIESPKGQARLAALYQLIGGSPRLWIVFAGCASTEALDDLVPAVEQLLEQLTPYYQQLLWDLSPVEAALISELGRGPAAAPAKAIAAAAGVDADSASTSLRRLTESKWVRSEKVPGTDQRTTWYRLREPLLRHHFQYRSDDHQPLALIVEILRAWFDPTDRSARLAGVGPGSDSERHLLAALRLDPPRRADSGWAAGDVSKLLAEARRWADEPDPMATPSTGVAVEALIIAVREGVEAAEPVLKQRGASTKVASAVLAAAKATMAEHPDASDREAVGSAMKHLAAACPAEIDQRMVSLIATCWNGLADPGAAALQLAAMRDPLDRSRLSLAIEDEYAFFTGNSGDPSQGRDLYAALIGDGVRILGPDHPDTLTIRRHHAYWTGQAGDVDAATVAYAALADDIDDAEPQAHRGSGDTSAQLIDFLLPSLIDGAALPGREHFGRVLGQTLYPLLRLFVDARNGSAEAAAQLPQELRSLVTPPTETLNDRATTRSS